MTVAIIFGVLGFICTGLVLIGLPGAWILLAVGVAIELLDHLWAGEGVVTFGWIPLALSVLLLVIGELLEGRPDLLAGAAPRRPEIDDHRRLA